MEGNQCENNNTAFWLQTYCNPFNVYKLAVKKKTEQKKILVATFTETSWVSAESNLFTDGINFRRGKTWILTNFSVNKWTIWCEIFLSSVNSNKLWSLKFVGHLIIWRWLDCWKYYERFDNRLHGISKRKQIKTIIIAAISTPNDWLIIIDARNDNK